ncbi:type IV secretory pathway VirB10-like protein [Bradyrhizobium sp. GM0.4]
MPKDYTGLPRQAPPLGPPLPGDLGKPILNAGAAPNTVVPGTAPDPEAQHRSQEVEAARVSRLFAQTNQQPHSVGQLIPNSSTATATTPAATPPVDAGSAQNMQDRKTAFLNASTDKRTVSPDRLEAKVSPYVVQAGTVIPAALNTGIRSDLPGQITAQVTEAVYDSPSGRYLLIPQGAKLIGQYDSSVAFGQSRILLVWTRIIMPEGTSIVLERQPGADTGGYAGLEDEVDNHWGMLFKAAVLSTMLSVGAEAGTSQNENNLVQAIRSGASNSISQTGQQIVQRQLNIQPTLTIRPGFPVRVIVTRDLVLAPYGQKGAR